jgi:hypothetical protein
MAAFFVLCVSMVAFFTPPEGDPEVSWLKFVIVAEFSVPALLFMVLGAFVYRGYNWKSSAGVVLVSAAGFSLVCVVTFAGIALSPEVQETFPDMPLFPFNDYVSGSAAIIMQACLGVFLLKAGRKSAEEQSPLMSQ